MFLKCVCNVRLKLSEWSGWSYSSNTPKAYTVGTGTTLLYVTFLSLSKYEYNSYMQENNLLIHKPTLR